MNTIDCVEIWINSLRALFEKIGIEVRFERSSEARSNPSCALNLRFGKVEADFVLWESGEAEVAVVDPNGYVDQKHIDDLNNPEKLAEVLSRIIGLLYAAAEVVV